MFLGRGAWILVKAQIAQVLLAQAWEATKAGGEPVKPWPWADTWPVARLTVPRLGVEEIVLAGGNGEAMAFGPGHLGTSAKPGSGGNVVLAGHRDTHFEFLRDLQPGDEILLEDADRRIRRYRVSEGGGGRSPEPPPARRHRRADFDADHVLSLRCRGSGRAFAVCGTGGGSIDNSRIAAGNLPDHSL